MRRAAFARATLLVLAVGGCSATTPPAHLARTGAPGPIGGTTEAGPHGNEEPSTGSGAIGPRFIGRFDDAEPNAPVFAWPGTAIALRFTGTTISATLSDSGKNVFEVVLDGTHSVLALKPGTHQYPLGRGLHAGPHDLLLYRRTEATFAETTFHGFDLPRSAYLPATVLPRKLEVIGDSISAGYGNEGAFPCAFTAATENHYLSYAALAARALHAELYTEAWSGIGMLHSYEGETADQMPVRYLRTLPERANSRWDFSRFVPDAVVINLGTNDFSKGNPGKRFQAAYLKFVSELRGRYPAARFFLAVGSMLSGESYGQAAAYLRAVIAARARAGDENLTLLEFGTHDPNADGLGCDYHPSLQTHRKMADKLVAALEADLGW